MQEWNENKELPSGYYYGTRVAKEDNSYTDKEVDSFLKVEDQFINENGDLFGIDDVAVFDNMPNYEAFKSIRKAIQSAKNCLLDTKNPNLRPAIDYLEHALDVMDKGKLEL